MRQKPERRRDVRWPAMWLLRAASGPLMLMVAVLAACATGVPRPRTNACDVAAVDDARPVSVDDVALFLHVRGAPCHEPAILWLHGGPGGAERPLFRLHAGDLEHDRLVAYWDQRGAGRSWDPAAPADALTIDRHLADLDRIIDALRARHGIAKVALVGHSWGAALGVLYARSHPEKLAGVVAVNPLISGLDSQLAQHRFVSRMVERTGDRGAARRLAQIGPPPLDAAGSLRLQTLVDRFGGYFHRRPSFLGTFVLGTLRGYFVPWEVGAFLRANETSLAAMNAELLDLDLTRRVARLEVPMALFIGRHDRQTDPSLALRFIDALEASERRVIWFEHSAHNIPFEEPEAFMHALRGILDDPRWTE